MVERELLATQANSNPAGALFVTPNKIRSTFKESRDNPDVERIFNVPNPHSASLYQNTNDVKSIRLIRPTMM